jgi:ribosomal protein S27E
MECGVELTFFRRRHHCRSCGKIMCKRCLPQRIVLKHISETVTCKVCGKCAEQIESEGSVPRVVEDRTVEDDEELAQAVVIQQEPAMLRDDSSGTFAPSSDDGDEV